MKDHERQSSSPGIYTVCKLVYGNFILSFSLRLMSATLASEEC